MIDGLDVIGFVMTAGVFFFGALIAEPILRLILRIMGLYTVVREGRCHVYVLFGKVIGVLEEPGLYLLFKHLGFKALFVGVLGKNMRENRRPKINKNNEQLF